MVVVLNDGQPILLFIVLFKRISQHPYLYHSSKMGKEVKEEKPRREKSADIVTRDYTIHMSKRLYGVSFKNRAPRAIREIKQFATKAMNTG